MENTLSVSKTISEAWQKLAGVKGSYWLAFVFLVVVGMVISGAPGIFPNHRFLAAVLQLVCIPVQICLGMGLSLFGIRCAAGLPADAKRAFDPLRFFWALLLCTMGMFLFLFIASLIPVMLIGIAAWLHAFGLVLLAVALVGIVYMYLCLAMFFAPALVVVGGLGPIEAIKMSITTFNRQWSTYLGLMATVSLINAISAIPLGIGLIWTMPLSTIIAGIAYREAFGVDAQRLEAIKVWR